MPRHHIPLRSLGYATDLDVLPASALIDDRGEYVVVRTPTNPTYYWGNFLLFRDPPGERVRWESLFELEHGDDSTRGSRHLSFGWDTVEGELGAAATELEAAGYEVSSSVTLAAGPSELRAHPRAHRDVTVRRLDPALGADAAAWQAVIDLNVETRDPGHDEAGHRTFSERIMADRRERFRAGDGAWFVAELDGEVIAGCGVIVTFGRGRYQAVETAPSHRRQGVASRLVHEAGRTAFRELGATRLVIVADADYHALPLYESLGFVARERTAGACWWPGAPNASRHQKARQH